MEENIVKNFMEDKLKIEKNTSKQFGLIMSDVSLVFVIAATLCILYLGYLGAYPLINPDEGRYAEIPREMLFSGNFITPHLNGVEYFEKPALQYWITTFSMYIFGENEFAVRLFPALCGLGGIFCAGFLGKKMFNDKVGYLSSLILATSFLYFIISSLNILDMGVSFFITLALTTFYQFSVTKKKYWLYLMYAAVAFATLTKGLIGIVLTFAVIIIYSLCTKQYRLLRDIVSVVGILIFLVITVPWFYLVCRDNPDFFYFFFIQEHFLRYLTKMHDRYQPFYFFIPCLILGIFPWTGFLGFSPKKIFAVKSLWQSLKDSSKRNEYVFLGLWFSIIFVFYSMSDSKLVPYIVPCLIPMAILIADKLLSIKNMKDKMKSALVINAVIAFFICIGLVIAAIKGNFMSAGEFLAVGGCLVLTLVVFSILNLFLWYKYHDVNKIILSYVLFALVFSFSLQPVINAVAQQRTSKNASAIVNLWKNDDSLIICYKDYVQDLPFYTKSRVAIYDYLGELEFGSKHPSGEGWFLNKEQLLKTWNDNPNVILVVPQKLKNDALSTLGIKSIDKEKIDLLEADRYVVIKKE